jgi:UDP-GlcNAc:undecaprenyl-phosphate GlcNAc-1-phosphate transferase
VALLSFLGPAVLAALVSFSLAPVARWASLRLGAIDEPDARKVHDQPMPRMGGLAVLAAMAIVAVLGGTGLLGSAITLPPALSRGLVLGIIPVIGVSFLDDLRGVRARWKLIAHTIAAVLAVQAGVCLNPEIHFLGEPLWIGVVAVPLSVLWIVGVTNAFNLVDGLDGLSAGLAFISSVSLAVVFVIAGERGTAASALVLAGALLGFLPYNAYPARIFLGDTGAASVGFVLACFALKGGSTLSAGFATILPILALGLPVAETTISFARRLIRRVEGGSGILGADRDHIHHRLLQLGISHRRAVLLLYGFGAAAALVGFVSLFLTSRQAGLLLGALLLAVFIGVKRLGYDEFAFLRRGLVLRVYDAPVVRTALFAVFFDLGLVAFAFYVARGLKREEWALHMPNAGTLTLVGLLASISVVTFWAFGLYRGTWRFASLDDVVRCAAAVVTSATVAWWVAPRFAEERASVSQVAVYALVSSALVCGSRISYRLLQNLQWKGAFTGMPVLLYGAGRGGAAALRELQGNPDWGMRPVGFLDDRPELRGKTVLGLPILGGAEALESAVRETNVQAVAITTRKIPEERVARIRVALRGLSLAFYRFDVRFEEDLQEVKGDEVALTPHPR